MTSSLQGLHLHFDCISGIAGDMTLGAFIDLGVPENYIRDAIAAVGIASERLGVARTVKRGIAAVNVTVDTSHDESHNGHVHHHYSTIRTQITSGGLSAAIQARAIDIFDRVARAEAKIHDTTVDAVAFHEVGAIDSIVDIVGAAAALTWLSPSRVSAAEVAMGYGTVRCAHGVIPVPSPAAVEVLREAGGVMVDGGVKRELCTPTGAAILASAVDEWRPMPATTPVATGYGAGDAELADRANVVRMVLGRPAGDPRSEQIVYQVEANIDDMSPELCEHAATCLFQAGALDVWWSPITMKRSRPALLLGVLVSHDALARVTDVVFRETTTIGVRYHRMQRTTLERDIMTVETRYGSVPVKIARRGPLVVNVAPEYEACRLAAGDNDVPLKHVFAAALAAFWAGSPGT